MYHIFTTVKMWYIFNSPQNQVSVGKGNSNIFFLSSGPHEKVLRDFFSSAQNRKT